MVVLSVHANVEDPDQAKAPVGLSDAAVRAIIAEYQDGEYEHNF
jgi:hypothetical protein